MNNLNSTRKCNFDWLVKEQTACSIIIIIIFFITSIYDLGFCQEDYTNVKNFQTQISEGGNAIIGEILGFHLKGKINRKNVYPDSDYNNFEQPSDRLMATYSEFQNSHDFSDIIGEYELYSFQIVYDNGATITNENMVASGKMSITSNILTQMFTMDNENIGLIGTYEIQSNSSLLVHNFMPVVQNSSLTYFFDGTYLTTTASAVGFLTETDVWRKVISYCSCVTGFTQNDIDMAREAGQQDCLNAPASCGLYSQEDLTSEYQRGCDTCSSGGNSAALLSNANIHIPEVNYESPLGVVKFWIDLEFLGNQDGNLIWKLSDFGQK